MADRDFRLIDFEAYLTNVYREKTSWQRTSHGKAELRHRQAGFFAYGQPV